MRLAQRAGLQARLQNGLVRLAPAFEFDILELPPAEFESVMVAFFQAASSPTGDVSARGGGNFRSPSTKIDPAALVEMVKFVNRPGTLEARLAALPNSRPPFGALSTGAGTKTRPFVRRGAAGAAARSGAGETRGARLIRVSLPIADEWQAHDIALDPPANNRFGTKHLVSRGRRALAKARANRRDPVEVEPMGGAWGS